MKKYSILIALLAIFSFSACDDTIDLVPRSELTFNGFWDTEDGARAAHTGIYANFRSQAYNFWAFGELRSDLWGGNTIESAWNIPFIENDFTATTAPFRNWAGFYTNIHRLNDFIKNVPNITFSNEAEKEHLLGQAHAIRAYYYYQLARTYGDVPIILVPMTDFNPEGLSVIRNPVTEVLDVVKKDIETSLTYFGSDNSFFKGKNTYWNKNASLALKGDVYLWTGKLYGGGNADYTIAKTSLEAIQDVSLETTFSNVFTNDTNSEFIFAFNYDEKEGANIFNSFTARGVDIHALYNDKGDSMIKKVFNGASRYGPTKKTLLATDDVLDSRRAATFMRLYKDSNTNNGYPTYDDNKYTVSLLNKFIGTVKSGGVRVMDNNVPVYRYADVVLMIAEAKNNLGEDPSSEINQIRARAYGANYDESIHKYSNASQTENTNAILNERLKEFVGEGKRWYDLRRAGDQFLMNEVKFITESYMVFLPITSNMIGRNPLLEQTAGY